MVTMPTGQHHGDVGDEPGDQFVDQSVGQRVVPADHETTRPGTPAPGHGHGTDRMAMLDNRHPKSIATPLLSNNGRRDSIRDISVSVVAQPGFFQIQATQQASPGGVADGARVEQPAEFGALYGQ